MKARAFLKWPGGKAWLWPHLSPLLPAHAEGVYYEPFLGGGSIYLRLRAAGRVRRAVLSDVNSELITTWAVARDYCEALVSALEYASAWAPDAAHFYALSRADLRPMSRVERATRFLFLNRTAFNGLYRENRAGVFNSSYGWHPRARFFDYENLRRVSPLLADAEFVTCDYRHATRGVVAGDVVFLDPPYVPLSRTSSFVGYHRTGFVSRDHRRVAAVFSRCVGVGAVAFACNSSAARSLYPGFSVLEVTAPRRIAARVEARQPTPELVFIGNGAHKIADEYRAA